MSALPAQRNPVLVYTSAPGSLYDSIIVAGRVQDMTSASISLFVRPLSSRTPVINPSSANSVPIVPTDANGNNVRHDWSSQEIATLGEGDFMGWWQFTLPSLTPQETPEFPILVTDHGPGTGTKTGAIVAGVTAFMPVTLDNLRKDERYGDQWLQNQAEVIKLRTLGTSVSPDSESGLGTVLLDYLSKRLALHLTTPAIEYWSRQWRTTTSTTTSEVAAYPDMIASLKELRTRLIHELKQEWRDLMAIQPGLAVRTVMPMPATTIGDPSDPMNGYMTRDPRTNDFLKTGGWGYELWGVFPFP